MHKGFTRTTLGVVGAALLSGSVFAAGPTLKNLPTVIITDKAKDGTFTCGVPYDGGTVLTAATENRYLFTDAIDLVDYSLPGDSTLDQVNFLFEEFASDASGAEGAARTASARAIAINGSLAYDAGGTIDRDTVLNNAVGDLQNDNVLTFVDQIRSGGDGTSPGPDPGGAFTDYALLKFYVASSNPGTAAAEVSMKSMSVITTNDTACDEGDILSVPTSIFTPEKCVDDFVGWWNTNSFAGLPDVSENLTTRPTAFSGNWTATTQPILTPTPTGSVTSSVGFGNVAVTESPTAALGVFTHASPGNAGTTDTTKAPQFAVWQSWRRDIEAAPKTTVPITADTVYMIRWTVEVQAATQSATSPQLPDVRFRVGENTSYGLGQAHDVLPAPGANGIVGAGVQEHRSYYYAPLNTPSGSEIGFMFDTFDFYQGTGGGFYTEGASDYGLDLQKIEVFSFDRADLDGETIELNAGNDSMTPGDGTTAPSGAAPFTRFDQAASVTTGDWEFRPGTFISGGVANTNRNPSGVFAANKLSMSLSAGTENATGEWDTRGYVLRQDPVNFAPDSTADEIVADIPNEKILFVDAWLSSPQGSTTNNHLPVVRVGFRTDVYGETGLLQSSPVRQITQGRVSYIEFRGWNRTDAEDVGSVIPSTNAITTAPKRFTAVMEPMIRTGSTIDVRPFVQFWSFPTDWRTEVVGTYLDDTLDAGTIEINRVVITSYDRPNLPDAQICQ
ncbi:MAG: hypothetical protein PWP23_419 [Candidatus Sumerlaeota bacterium]|nr:hypothetical protein [Candidatus Sumerlaeota bacterium]